MNKTIDLTQAGGLYVYQSTLDWMQDGYKQILDAMALFFGDKVIITGLTPAGNNVSDGWAVVNGELLPVVGGQVLAYLTIETITTNEQFDDGTQKPVYTVKRLKFSSIAANNYAWSDFKRLAYNSLSVKDALDNVKTLIKNSVNVEAAVILSGCTTSNLNVGASTVTISAGLVLMDGEYVNAPLYNGQYPVYLKNDGTYTTVQPGAGTYITFNHETSQRYKYVLKRFMHESGEVVMSTNPADLNYFDLATGLGKWKWQGWKLSEVLQDRVPLGYDRRAADPGDGVWDINYHGVGNTGGEKKHTLTIAEMPAHSHTFSGSGDQNPDDSAINHYPLLRQNPDRPGDQSGNMNNTGGDAPHENRQPYSVALFIERI